MSTTDTDDDTIKMERFDAGARRYWAITGYHPNDAFVTRERRGKGRWKNQWVSDPDWRTPRYRSFAEACAAAAKFAADDTIDDPAVLRQIIVSLDRERALMLARIDDQIAAVQRRLDDALAMPGPAPQEGSREP
jgi:hypothetical protein